MSGLDFEKPILELEAKIKELKNFGSDKKINLVPEIKKLEQKLEKMKKDIYENLTDWQRVQIARHPQRPYTCDYIHMLTSDFLELHGDRLFADDFAMIAGFATMYTIFYFQARRKKREGRNAAAGGPASAGAAAFPVHEVRH